MWTSKCNNHVVQDMARTALPNGTWTLRAIVNEQNVLYLSDDDGCLKSFDCMIRVY